MAEPRWYNPTKHLPDSIPMEAIAGLVEPVVRYASRPGVPPNRGYVVRADVLPPFESFFKFNETAGSPDAPANASGAAAFKNIILRWDLPSNALFRTFEVYEGTTAGFTPDVTTFANRVLATSQTVVSLAKSVGATTYYYKICAVNTRGERSSFVALGPYVLATATNAEIESIAASKITAGSLAADVAILANLSATKITAGTLDCSKLTVTNLNAGAITAGILSAIAIDGVTITGSTVTGGIFQTATTGERIVISSTGASRVRFETSVPLQVAPGLLEVAVVTNTEGKRGYLFLRSPNCGSGAGAGAASLEMWAGQPLTSPSVHLDAGGTDLWLDSAGVLINNHVILDSTASLKFGGGDPFTVAAKALKWNGTGIDVGRNAADNGWVDTKTGPLGVVGALTLWDGTNDLRLRVFGGVFQKSYNGTTWASV